MKIFENDGKPEAYSTISELAKTLEIASEHDPLLRKRIGLLARRGAQPRQLSPLRPKLAATAPLHPRGPVNRLHAGRRENAPQRAKRIVAFLSTGSATYRKAIGRDRDAIGKPAARPPIVEVLTAEMSRHRASQLLPRDHGTRGTLGLRLTKRCIRQLLWCHWRQLWVASAIALPEGRLSDNP